MSLLCVSMHKEIPTEGHKTSSCHHTSAIEPQRGGGGTLVYD